MRARTRAVAAELAAHLVLIASSAAILLPLLWALWVSLAGRPVADEGPPGWGEPGLASYVEAFAAHPLASWMLDSLAVGAGSAAVALPLATTLAYALARGTGGSGLRLALLAGAALPPVALALPLFTIFLAAGRLDSFAALVTAHAALNLPLLTLMLIAPFRDEGARRLEEMARVEGASRSRAFLRAAVPAAAPAIAAAGLLAFVLSWNELLLALVLSGEATRTLPVGLTALETPRGAGVPTVAAATLLACLPTAALLPLLRRHLVRGLSLGASG